MTPNQSLIGEGVVPPKVKEISEILGSKECFFLGLA